MPNRPNWILLGLIAALHFGFAVWFAAITPYHHAGKIGPADAQDIGAPDEIAHATYVDEILSGKGVPSLDLARMKSDKDYRANHYEDHQPPAFYVLDAAWCKVLGVGTAVDPDSGLKVRALNAVLGSATVLAAFFAAFWGFRRLDLAYGAAAIVAFLPMNVALSGALSNDPMLFAILGWVLALCTRGLRDGWRARDLIIAGLLAGLAILTKTTGIVTIPVIIASLALPQPQRPALPVIAICVAAFALLAAPWFVRNQSVYGDPLGVRVFNEAFSDTAKKEDIENIIVSQGGKASDYWTQWVGWTTARSFIGAFGYMDIWLNESGTAKTGPNNPNSLYRALLAIMAILALGWLISLRTEWAKEAWPITVLNGIFLLTVIFLFVRFNGVYYQAQARYLFPAIIPIAIGFASGCVALGNLGEMRGLKGAKSYAAVAVALFCVVLAGVTVYAGMRLPDEFSKRLS